MKKCFSNGIAIVVIVLLFGKIINDIKINNGVKNIIEQSVISVQYEDGFVILELENNEQHYSNIEKYSIDIVDIKYINERNNYIKKYFNGYGKLVKVELFSNINIF